MTGQIQSIEAKTYEGRIDGKGQFERVKYSGEYGPSKVLLTFDKKSNPISLTEYDTNGRTISTTTYVYEKNLLKSVSISGDQGEETISYEYQDGKLVKKVFKGYYDDQIEYKYDNGVLEESEQQNMSNSKLLGNEYGVVKYSNPVPYLLRREHVYRFDENNDFPIHIGLFSTDGRPLAMCSTFGGKQYVNLDYNEEGFCSWIHGQFVDVFDLVDERSMNNKYNFSYEYEYDEVGNWVRRIGYAQDDQIMVITERTITYFKKGKRGSKKPSVSSTLAEIDRSIDEAVSSSLDFFVDGLSESGYRGWDTHTSINQILREQRYREIQQGDYNYYETKATECSLGQIKESFQLDEFEEIRSYTLLISPSQSFNMFIPRIIDRVSQTIKDKLKVEGWSDIVQGREVDYFGAFALSSFDGLIWIYYFPKAN